MILSNAVIFVIDAFFFAHDDIMHPSILGAQKHSPRSPSSTEFIVAVGWIVLLYWTCDVVMSYGLKVGFAKFEGERIKTAAFLVEEFR